MSAPRRPADVPGIGPDPMLLEQYVQHELHLDDRGRVPSWSQIGPDDLVRDGLAVLAIGQALTQRIADRRWGWVVEVLRAGATVTDVATALDLDDDEVQAGLRSWADGQQRLNDREGRFGLTPAEADQVRALVDAIGAGR